MALSVIRDTKNSESIYRKSLWSPDGACLLSSTYIEGNSINQFLMYGFPESISEKIRNEGNYANDQISPKYYSESANWDSTSQIIEAESNYDFCWYPRMSIQDNTSSCFIASSRDQPIKMWDVYSSKVRCKYNPCDDKDELVSPLTLTFDNFGSKIIGGFDSSVKIFDIDRPGKEFENIPTCVTKKSREGLRGTISSLSISPSDNSILAIGTFNKRFGLIDLSSGSMIHVSSPFSGCGDISQIKFICGGNYLLTAARKQNRIMCWDMRYLDRPLVSMERKGDTNQRIFFDVDPYNKYLSTGDQMGNIIFYSLDNIVKSAFSEEQSLSDQFCDYDSALNVVKISQNTVTSTVFHPTRPDFIAYCGGERNVTLDTQWSCSDSESEQSQPEDEGLGFLGLLFENKIFRSSS